MHTIRNCLIGWVLFMGASASTAEERTTALGKTPSAPASDVDFLRDIQPIFAAKCVSCHNVAKERGGLRLDDGAAALKGGDSGVVIVPGKSAESRLVRLVAGLDPDLKMPPKGPGLSEAEIGKLRAWIDRGAPWPKQATIAATNKPLSSHWSFQPLKRPAPPLPTDSGRIRNDIDAFIIARLEKEGVAPSPEADRVTLIRRLSLDLLGLLPTVKEVDDFVNDSRPDAYELLVDRLLASPHYGERWGRHWLDLARYADSDGYEKDNPRPFAWRYRNWVIETLNRDLPFDRFTIEQLAGDLLPNATLDQKVATGFHRNTLTNTEGGVDKEQFRVEAVVDRVNTTAKVFLGATLGCAQCHDHKYDPFSQRDYYRFFAFFNSDNEVNLPAPLPGEDAVYRQKKADYDKKKTELQTVVDAFVKNALPVRQAKWESELKVSELRSFHAEIIQILLNDPKTRTEKQKQRLTDHYALIDKKMVELKKKAAEVEKTAPQMSLAQTLALGSPRKTHVLIRGDFLRQGATVEAAMPAVLSTSKAAQGSSRLDLAKWLVDPNNPLTARVIVNWMWQKYFGRGLVATLEDFGTQGEKPSHPELLDWLASEFVAPSVSPSPLAGEGRGGAPRRERAWSLKAMHKLIVTSATYRQSSQTRPKLQSRDPLNVLLARQQRPRLEAEVLRDIALAASGLLNPTIGGPSVRPPQPAGISEITYGGGLKWAESQGSDRYRRGLYTWFQRTSPYPMLMTFDAPDSNLSCVRREKSNTPLQALTMLNDTTFVECAQAFGRRIADECKGGAADRLRYAFRVAVSREPSPSELVVLHRLFNELLQNCRNHPEEACKLVGNYKPAHADPVESAAWVAMARTVLNLDEFVTRE